MTLEQNLLLFLWFAGTALIAFAVPRNRWHAFLLSFLTVQGIAWVMEALLLELRVVTYPIREFPQATMLAVTNMIFFIPVMGGLYVTYEPRRSWQIRLVYLVAWSCTLASIDNLIAAYTKLTDYTGFNWWWALLVFAFKLAAAKGVVRWFFREPTAFRSEKKAKANL